jgi:hypothetical protein
MKTIAVKKIVEKANIILANKEVSRECKVGVICMLEYVLHSTNNYNGFYFINEDSRPMDEDYYDRKYFLSHRLK